MLSNAVGSELIKLRAYRLTYWLLPLALVFLVTAAAFGFDSVRLSAAEAAPQSVLIDSAAYAFGLGSPLSGLVLGVFAALIVTADQGSGTIYQSLLVLSRRTVVLAKVLASGAAAALITAVGTFAIAAVALVMLPGSLVGALAAAPALWVTLAGTLVSHLTWVAVGLGFSLLLQRQASAVGAMVMLLFVVPMVERRSLPPDAPRTGSGTFRPASCRPRPEPSQRSRARPPCSRVCCYLAGASRSSKPAGCAFDAARTVGLRRPHWSSASSMSRAVGGLPAEPTDDDDVIGPQPTTTPHSWARAASWARLRLSVLRSSRLT